MVALPRSAYRAMSTQLDRVNDGSRKAAAQADVADWLDRVAPERLTETPDWRDEELARLRLQVEQLQMRVDELTTPGAHVLGQRPVISAVEAAERANVSLATVNRYLWSGFWQGVQDDSGRWLVFADQPLLPKERNQKGR